jgi:cell wall-associated NlpC family hydrolase
MASTKSRSAKQSGTRRRTSTASAKTRNRKTTTASKRGTGGKSASPKPRRRSRAKQPSTQEKVMQAVRSAKGPGLAAGAAASVVGGVALVVRSRRSSGFDARGLAKRIGETTKSLGKTSKELGKEMQRLGDDAEKAGKTLS